MFVDFDASPLSVEGVAQMDVLNEAGGQEVGETLRGVQWDSGLMRPYEDKFGNARVDILTGRVVPKKKNGKIVQNEETGEPIMERERRSEKVMNLALQARKCPLGIVTNATILRKDAWIKLDEEVLEAILDELRVYADIRGAGLTYGGFDAMATPILEYERMTHTGTAHMDMDAMTEGTNFAPKFDLAGQPLPIIHADFFLSDRFRAISSNRGRSAENIRADMAGRVCGELLEKMTLGYDTSPFAYGDQGTDYAYASKVFGLMNHGDIITKTDFTAPTADGWTPETTYNEFLAAIEDLLAQEFKGPFVIYYSTDWNQYFNRIFSTDGGNHPGETLRSMLLSMPEIKDLRRSAYLPSATYPFRMVFTEMNKRTVQAINGMDWTTVMWPSMGGLRHNYKVMGIQVPRVRSSYIRSTGTTKAGILLGTTS